MYFKPNFDEILPTKPNKTQGLYLGNL